MNFPINQENKKGKKVGKQEKGNNQLWIKKGKTNVEFK